MFLICENILSYWRVGVQTFVSYFSAAFCSPSSTVPYLLSEKSETGYLPFLPLSFMCFTVFKQPPTICHRRRQTDLFKYSIFTY